VRLPAADGPHLVGASDPTRLGPQDVLEQDAKRVRQAGDVHLAGEGVEPGDGEGAPAGVDLIECSEAVHCSFATRL
jgi:hypothetical protein